MRRKSYRKYLILGVALFLLVTFPALLVEKMRAAIVGISTWPFRKIGSSEIKTHERERLEGENHLLRVEIGKLRALLEQKERMALLSQEVNPSQFSPRRCDQMSYLLGFMNRAVPARVIYRDPGNWSSTLWINVGEETNHQLNCAVIQKNSPVILGRAVIGAVDYVGKKQSRIRLITDVAMNPSVRVVRGSQQNRLLLETIDLLLRHLKLRNDLPLSAQEKNSLAATLEGMKEKTSADNESWYLAKGILQGAATPRFRSVNHTLRGVGFNYDFSDEEGPAREFATGKPIGGAANIPLMPIIHEGDLLMTTGMDGVFPAGLRVAEVTKIYPLREGAYTYELEAVPVVGNLDALQTVFIIPPLGYSMEESP